MTYTEKYGKPQGNEFVYGKDIIRRTDTFEFSVIDRFISSKDAHSAYAQWMKENNLYDNKWKHPNDYKIWTDAKENILKHQDTCPVCEGKIKDLEWKYVKPIIGWDENGQPIIHDS